MRILLIILLAIEGIALGLTFFVVGFFTFLTGFNWQWVLLTIGIFGCMAACGFVQKQLKAGNTDPWLAAGVALIVIGCLGVVLFRRHG